MKQYDAWAQGWGTKDHVAPPGPDGKPRDPETEDCCLDPGVYELVWGLYEVGVHTGWSCQGGGTANGHGYLFRVIAGGVNDAQWGIRATAAALERGMPLRTVHRVLDPGENTFWWELHFDRFTEWKRKT